MGRATAIAILLALVGGAAYFFFIRSSGSPNENPTSYMQEVQDKLAQYQRIENLSPDLSVLNDKLFQALHSSGASLASISGTSTVLVSASSTNAMRHGNPFTGF